MNPRTMQAIFDASPEAVIVTDRQGVIRLVSRQVKELFGYDFTELIDREIEILIPQRYATHYRAHRDEFVRATDIREMGSSDLALTAVCKDGREINVKIGLSSVDVDEQRLIIASIRNISQKIQLTQQLKAALYELEAKNRELEQFAYIASHDLQEPLRTVSGFVMLLEHHSKIAVDEEAREYLQYIRQASDRMRSLIKALLDYSLLGKEAEKQRIDLNVILEQVLADLNYQITERFAIITSDHLPMVTAYEIAMRELFQNLISNALKYQRHGLVPKISIRVRRKQSEWVFEVADNGIGIDPRYKEKIFGIFQRLHARSEYSGTGIGLAHCKKIVDLHGGRIWVESDGTSGSTFYFTLPNPVRS